MGFGSLGEGGRGGGRVEVYFSFSFEGQGVGAGETDGAGRARRAFAGWSFGRVYTLDLASLLTAIPRRMHRISSDLRS